MVGSINRARRADQTLNRAQSSGGTPSSSAMTMIGKGRATACMKSKPDGSSMPSNSPSMMHRILGSSAWTAPAAKALLTRLRNRVWSGRIQKQQVRLVVRRQHGQLARRQRALARVVAEVAVVAQHGPDIRVAR